MAFNNETVTAGKANIVKGPLLWNPTPETDVTVETDFSTGGWIRLGYGSTDGASVKQSVDSDDKNVWGANLGKIYSNFSDVFTVNFASFLDSDVLGVLYGSKNVTVPEAGVRRVAVKNREPNVGTLVIAGVSDSGKDIYWVMPIAQAPLELDYDVTQDDIITIKAEFTGAPSTTTQETSYIVYSDATAIKGE